MTAAPTTPKGTPVAEKDPTKQPGAPEAPGVAPDETVVATGPKAPAVTDGEKIHSTGQDPDGGQKPEAVAQAVAEGVPPVPVPAASTVLYATPGGYQVTPAGVDPEQVGVNAIGR